MVLTAIRPGFLSIFQAINLFENEFSAFVPRNVPKDIKEN
jgi:hypothetical protein